MSDYREPWMRDDDEEEDMQDENSYKSQKDAIVFAIDISPSMLAPPADNPKADSPAMAALKCAAHLMQQRIISNPKDMMGVLLYGTEETNLNDEGSRSDRDKYPHCYMLTDLDIPSAEDVQMLKKITEGEDGAQALLVPTTDVFRISDLLFCANQKFNTQAPAFDSRRLFIITDNDNPHAGDKKAMGVSSTRAKDLYDLGVIIELFPISQPDQSFDRTKFYDDIIYRDPNEIDGASAGSTKLNSSGISLLNDLISDINSKQVAKRSLFTDLPFEIGPGFKISVKGYNILQKQAPARSHFVYTGGEVAQIALGETTKARDDTEEKVEATEIRKAYKFGGDAVVFTADEQKELKNFGSPVLRIIGFKPQNMLPMWASIKKSTFVYPSESDYVGSIRVFGALWKKLLDDKKMGLAWYIPRINSKPAIVAIIPSDEKFNDQGGQIAPQGLWLYQLPFADDIRQPAEVPKPILATDALVDDMRVVVQQLQLPKATYDPSRYPNPSLQWHYRILQAMALGDEVPENPIDKTIGKHKQIHKRAGEYINKWGVTLEEQFQAGARERKGSVKRELDDEDDDKPKKKAKVKGDAQKLEDMSDGDVKKAVDAGTLTKRTMPELKAWCTMKGLSVSGKKADLLERIEHWCEEN